MTTRAYVPAVRISLLATCIVVGISICAEPTSEQLLQKAQQAYEAHNYRNAVENLDRLLADREGQERLWPAERLKALSLCRLSNQNGASYARSIMEAHEPFRSDPELWEAIGYDRRRHWPRKEAYLAYAKAGELYEERGSANRAFDAWMQVVEILRRDQSLLPREVTSSQAEKLDWPERHQLRVREILRICGHVAELKVEDERKAKALRTGGEIAASDGAWELASEGIVLLRRCAEEYPKEAQAPEAQFLIAQAFERFSRFVEAIKEYQRLFQDFPTHQRSTDARAQIKGITNPRVGLWVTQAFLPNERPRLYWQARNVKRLHLVARRVDLVEAVGRMQTLDDALDVLEKSPGEEVARWTFDTPDEGKHQYHLHVPGEENQTTVPIDPLLEEPGAYVVRVEGATPDGRTDHAACLVVISDLSAIAKVDSNEVLVFAARSVSGEPVSDARVVVTRRSIQRPQRLDRIQGRTNDAGACHLELPDQRRSRWITAVRKGEHQAICTPGAFQWYWRGRGKGLQTYGFTDRPVYRPGQTVHFKEILRVHDDGQYTNAPDRTVRVEIRDPKGEVLYAHDHVTDEYGALEGSLKLGEGPPLGVYSIVLAQGGRRIGQSAGSRFRVEEYRKPEFEVTISAAEPDYRIGDEVSIRIAAKYYFGQPVADAEVAYRIRKQSYEHHSVVPRPWPWYYEQVFRGGRYGGPWSWWRPRFEEQVASGTIRTDSNGEALVVLEAKPIQHHEDLDIKFIVSADVTDASRRVIRGQGEVKVTHAPFFILPRAAMSLYAPGDSVEVRVRTESPNGESVPGRFSVEAWRLERTREVDEKGSAQIEEKLAQRVFAGEVNIPDTGRGNIRFVPDVTGRLRIIVREAAPPAGRKSVEGSCDLWVASRTGAEAHYAYNDLQVVPASDQYEVGQTLRLLVNTARPNSRVLLTGEADGLLLHRIVHVEKNSTLVEIPIEEELSPNFTLTATMLRDGKIFRDSKPIVVPPTHKFLKVEIETGPGSLGGGQNRTYQPREKAPLRVRVTDQRTGKPVVGQVAIMLVDASVYYIQPEFREAIEKAFYGSTRPVHVSTTDSYAGPASLSRGWIARPSLGRRAGGAGAPMASAQLAEKSMMMDRAGEAGADSVRGRKAEGGLATTIVRKQFRDTVLWAGSLVTDGDGIAQIPVTMPDQLTTFALHAVAFDKDTRVGQARVDLVTAKRIIVRLESGRFFTEGDHSYVTLIAHNYFDEPQPLTLDLAVQGGLRLREVKVDGKWTDYDSGAPLKVTVPAGGEARLDFKTTAMTPGEVRLMARARGERESDAIKLTRPIIPWGASRLVSQGGALRGDEASHRFSITVPEAIRSGSQSLTLTLSPSIAAVAMDALPYLAAYPYGCVEQTMSRFLPTVTLRRTLQEAGVSLDDVRTMIETRAAGDPKLAARLELLRKRMRRNPVYSSAETEKMIHAGIKRLADMQHTDGSWGWWKQDTGNAYMTAYVLSGLALARDADVRLPDGMVEKATAWLIVQASQPKLRDEKNWWRRHLDNDNTRTYALYAISRTRPAALQDKALATQVDRIFRERDELSDYGRALLALVLHAADRQADAGTVVDNLDNTAVLNDAKDTAHWGKRDGWWYWYHGSDETTAWVLQAMLTLRPESRYVPLSVNYLVRSRRGLTWHNTKSTAMVVYALARYAKVAGELDCDQTFDIAIDDQIRKSVRVRRENLFAFEDRIVLDAEALSPGEHTVEISRRGKGSLYWGAHLRYHDTAERIRGGGNRVAVARKYFRLVREEFTNTRRIWRSGEVVEERFPDARFRREPIAFGDEIASGQLLEVQLDITCEDNLEYLVFEDPKPAGCEPYRLRSGSSYGGGTYANMELRDTKVVFFATGLSQGKHSLAYKLQCEQPGTFRVLPASGEAMYAPFVEAISDSDLMTITEKPEN
jgi:alpha-2-macroglobulin